MLNLRFLTLVLVAVLGHQALAHKHHEHAHHHEPHEIQIGGDGQVGPEGLRALLDDAHHAIEAHGEGSFLSRWRDKFRWKNVLLNAYRWHGQNSQRPEVANASANIALLFLTSHALETAGGAALAGLGLAQDVGDLSQIVLTAVGVSVTIPGLDPLCLVLIGAYGKWPSGMNRLLDKPRVMIVGATKAAGAWAGVPDGYLSAWAADSAKRKFLRAVSARGEAYRLDELTDKSLSMTVLGAHEGQEIRFEFARLGDGRFGLQRLRFSPRSRAMVRAYMRELSRPFGWNIQNLIMDLDRALQDGQAADFARAPYVRDLHLHGDGEAIVDLHPAAFPFHRLSPGEVDCGKWLTGS